MLAGSAKTLHLAPGQSGGGSLIQALEQARRADQVLIHSDDLSFGPIDPITMATRAECWSNFCDIEEMRSYFSKFWDSLDRWDGRLVLWFSRHSARELAFYLAIVNHLQNRPFETIDVTGLRVKVMKRDGTMMISAPTRAMSLIQSGSLEPLIDSGYPVTDSERKTAEMRWLLLKRENAPFRVIGENGLESASDDCFDSTLLANALSSWQKISVLISKSMEMLWEPYIQVYDLMLLTRVVALVEMGKLIADGDPWEMRDCQVRLAE